MSSMQLQLGDQELCGKAFEEMVLLYALNTVLPNPLKHHFQISWPMF